MSPNLRYFVLSSESKRLYNRFMKLIRQIEDKQQKQDLRRWIKEEFKLNKSLTHEIDIKSQHVRARSAIQELEISIDLSQAKDGSK